MTDRQARVLAVLLAAVGLAIVLLVVLLLMGSDEGGEPAATATTSAPTTGVTTTTLARTTSSTSPTTSSTTLLTTTAPTSSTTTTSTTTTTTIPPLTLQADGIGGVAFGVPPDEAIDYATGLLGPSKADTGWSDAFSKYGTCPPPEVRGVEWGGAEGFYGFVLLFTKAETAFRPEGGEHFFAYYYVDGTNPVGLGTAENIFIGSSLTELQAAYGSALEIFDDEIFGTTWFAERDFDTDRVLGGSLTGEAANDFVETINGGVGCAE